MGRQLLTVREPFRFQVFGSGSAGREISEAMRSVMNVVVGMKQMAVTAKT